ncbi:MAG: 23S rRNA (pseudouridine(1915)-N(3))-methyltransferase RlmH [Oscillospiraceae bacterium]|nr:23S rRNA (pseudouridine(1915)-N(3))-methyltransferase RlmH [Oscillospiraceae bacterium]
MLGIDIVCVGKLKEKFFIDACCEYTKRLSAYCRLSVVEVSEVPVRTAAEIERALEEEGKRILAKIPSDAYVIAMCVEGGQMPSDKLAAKLSSLKVNGVSKICFLIGGSNGISENVKSRAALRLSMSEMTFPHHLARVMLLEQIYRAFKIEEGSGYHK